MTKKYCLKITERFWKEHTKARAALDQERADAPVSKKIEIAERLRRDALFLKTGKLIPSKKS